MALRPLLLLLLGATWLLFAGAVRFTVGGALTIRLTAVEVVTAPALSVALAVRL